MFKEKTILVSTWGYGQTNKDFYQVVGTTPKGVKVVKMNDTIVSFDAIHRSYKKIPTTPMNHKPITKKIYINEYNNKPYISVSSWADAYEWGGEPETFDENY